MWNKESLGTPGCWRLSPPWPWHQGIFFISLLLSLLLLLLLWMLVLLSNIPCHVENSSWLHFFGQESNSLLPKNPNRSWSPIPPLIYIPASVKRIHSYSTFCTWVKVIWVKRNIINFVPLVWLYKSMRIICHHLRNCSLYYANWLLCTQSTSYL